MPIQLTCIVLYSALMWLDNSMPTCRRLYVIIITSYGSVSSFMPTDMQMAASGLPPMATSIFVYML